MYDFLFVLLFTVSHYDRRIITGHEFVGEVVALGSSYSPDAKDRPPLYSTLRIGDKVVSPFTSSCGECECVFFTLLAVRKLTFIDCLL